MRKSALQIIVGVLLATGGFVAGYQVAWNQGSEMLVTEVAGNLAFHVDVLSRLRGGDRDSAIGELEGSVDRALLTLTANDAGDLSGVRAAKLYRSVVPSEVDAVEEALSKVEMPEPSNCAPALQDLVEAR